jgi:hypothetical protein
MTEYLDLSNTIRPTFRQNVPGAQESNVSVLDRWLPKTNDPRALADDGLQSGEDDEEGKDLDASANIVGPDADEMPADIHTVDVPLVLPSAGDTADV